MHQLGAWLLRRNRTGSACRSVLTNSPAFARPLLQVVKLKEELKKRGQAVSGKKAELVERLQSYISQHEVRGVRRLPGREDAGRLRCCCSARGSAIALCNYRLAC